MRKAFGERVRCLRRERNVTGAALGKMLKCTQANISKIESGQIKPSLPLAEQIGKVLQLPTMQRRELCELATNYLYDFDRWSFEETDQYFLYQNSIGTKEQAASVLWSFNWNVIPGLLQTREYIEEMHRPLGLDEKRFDEVVEARLKRQKVLADKKKVFRYLLAEQTLYTVLTKTSAHNTQLRRLRGKIDKTEGRVAVRVLPRDLRLRLIPNVNFVILDFKSVLVDEQYRSFLVWYEGQVEAYRALFDDLWERAESGVAAQKLIDSAIEYFEHRRSDDSGS